MSKKPEYYQVCEKPNDLPLFHQHWWLDATCRAWDVVIVKKGDFIAGGLNTIAYKRSWFMKIFRTFGFDFRSISFGKIGRAYCNF